MRNIAGSILVLAGAVLFASGVIAEAVTRGAGAYGHRGFVLGIVVGLLGGLFLFAGPLRRLWDAIPTDDKRPRPPRADADSKEARRPPEA